MSNKIKTKENGRIEIIHYQNPATAGWVNIPDGSIPEYDTPDGKEAVLYYKTQTTVDAFDVESSEVGIVFENAEAE